MHNNTTTNSSFFYDESCMAEDEPYIMFYRFVTNGVLLNLIGAFGILGNIISMIILSRPQMRSSINYLLIGLARVDTVLILTSILLFGLPGIYPHSKVLFNYYYFVYPHIAPFVYPLAMMAQTASVYLTLTVSLERFVAVCHPLRARALCTYGRARAYVIGICLFSVLYNLPRLWESGIQEDYYDKFNMTVYCPRPSNFRNNQLYMTIYIHWLYLIFLYMLPFISLAVLNASIYRQVLKANKERQRLSRIQKREIGLATMLMFVVVVFFICNLLPLVINIIETFELDMDIAMMIPTSNLLVTINSSVNFIIYVIFGEKFQRIFFMLFCNNALFRGERDSPDIHDDSFMSNGDRNSLRLQRQSTSISRNGPSGKSRLNSTLRRQKSTNQAPQLQLPLRGSPAPGPCVYYPPTHRASKEISAYTTQISIPSE